MLSAKVSIPASMRGITSDCEIRRGTVKKGGVKAVMMREDAGELSSSTIASAALFKVSETKEAFAGMTN